MDMHFCTDFDELADDSKREEAISIYDENAWSNYQSLKKMVDEHEAGKTIDLKEFEYCYNDIGDHLEPSLSMTLTDDPNKMIRFLFEQLSDEGDCDLDGCLNFLFDKTDDLDA